ncbi:MAG: hypothetical protein GY793_08935 [Proteobacteria bacterium]|nr:hypothetical protein [Pseudomonadota bacterium]
MIDFDNVPAFMLDRAIIALEKLRDNINSEISSLHQEKRGRDLRRRKKRQIDEILQDIMINDYPDENSARIIFCEQGHSWKYSEEIFRAFKKQITAQKKAAKELEIFRRWYTGKEKKAALAREHGLSRATVGRICKKLSIGATGLKGNYKIYRALTNKRKVW